MAEPSDRDLAASGPEVGGDGHRPGELELRTPDALVQAVRRLEEAEELDGAVRVVDRLAAAVAPSGPARDLLTGRWLGHALHPTLTDLPIGSWTSATILDLVGGRASRTASRRLVAFGNVAALPTVATGLAELLSADRPTRRVGVVHLAANAVGLLFYTASYGARRRGHHIRGMMLALVGAGSATVGGYLGGHLAIARKAGTRDDRLLTSLPEVSTT